MFAVSYRFSQFCRIIIYSLSLLNRQAPLIGFAYLTPKNLSSCNVPLDDKKGGYMVRKTYTPEQIINKLRQAEVLLSQVVTIGEASRKIGVV